MAVVRIPSQETVLTGQQEVTAFLGRYGIEYERWTADRPVGADASNDDLLLAYRHEIEALKARGGYRAVDDPSLSGLATPARISLLVIFLGLGLAGLLWAVSVLVA